MDGPGPGPGPGLLRLRHQKGSMITFSASQKPLILGVPNVPVVTGRLSKRSIKIRAAAVALEEKRGSVVTASGDGNEGDGGGGSGGQLGGNVV